MRKKGWKSLAVGSFASLLLLAGCGESDSTYKVGITQIAEHPSLDVAVEGFQKALEDKGVDVEYDIQNAQGDPNNNMTIANNFVGDSVDLIFANSTPSALSALNATGEIPIVFTSVTDPVGAELVEAIDKPGPNITGTTDMHPDAIPNTIQFIAEQFPETKTIGMVYNSGEQNSVAQVELVNKELEGTGMATELVSVSTPAEVKQATEALIGRADVIYIITDNTVVSALDSVIQVASDEDIPLFVGELDSVAAGGFAAYGFDYYEIGYEAGEMAAQILLGEKTATELPVQYPQNLRLQINKQAAEDMGITLKPEWDDIAEYVNE
ncbi:ABC transporter substrate-binding protein [Bacillus sp. PS06]|uniref:ABC transporter substrate-binding protein n=1 Tax=Bacillus sp. PS06 TaxID=2764176 RepID=UPI001780E66F|nr:ABC transporter substrate-binding protein [Bacillus sp. PS06]MBD8067621.1 ABC transporter substrate-binding protein [Bacillus sp. PS06]